MNWIEWEALALERVNRMREEARMARLQPNPWLRQLARGLVWLARRLDKQVLVTELREARHG